MGFDVELNGRITPDHRLEVDLPKDLPPGDIVVTVRYAEPPTPAIRTAKDLLASGFVGAGKTGDDLPKHAEDLPEWRRRVWEGAPE